MSFEGYLVAEENRSRRSSYLFVEFQVIVVHTTGCRIVNALIFHAFLPNGHCLIGIAPNIRFYSVKYGIRHIFVTRQTRDNHFVDGVATDSVVESTGLVVILAVEELSVACTDTQRMSYIDRLLDNQIQRVDDEVAVWKCLDIRIDMGIATDDAMPYNGIA